jgi:hypothetical protein
MTVDRWSFSRTFGVAYLAIVGTLIFIGRDLYFGPPLHEVGDLAANALQVARAKEFAEIYGNYSRFNFHHPGPAFFYVYAAGEVLFHDVIPLSAAAHNAHLLAAAALQASFLAAGISVLARYAAPNRSLFVALAFGIALLHFGLVAHPQLSIWSPNAIVWPFATFLIVAAALATGWITVLPLMVICGGFLVHGHVAQPLFVLPLGSAAYVVGLWRTRTVGGRSFGLTATANLRAHGLAFALLAIFLAPIALDAIQGPTSNLAAIIDFLESPRTQDDSHSTVQVAGYLLSFFGYSPSDYELRFSVETLAEFASSRWPALMVASLGIAIAPAAGWLALDRPTRSMIRAPLTSLVVTLSVTLGLTVVWIVITRGPLYLFNSFFVYGLIYVALLPGALLACLRWPRGSHAHAATIVVGVAILAVTITQQRPTPLAEDPRGPVLAARSVALATSPPGQRDRILLVFEGPHWPFAASIALALERNGVAWYVDSYWRLIFGPEHLYSHIDGRPPEVWILTTPNGVHSDQVVLSPEVAIYPRPDRLDRGR